METASTAGENYFGRRLKKVSFDKRFETLQVDIDPKTNGIVKVGDIEIEVKNGVPKIKK